MESRMDVQLFTQEGTGLMFGLIERTPEGLIYHIGLVTIDALVNRDVDVMATITIGQDSADEDALPRVRDLANSLGVAVTEDEVEYCFDKLNSREKHYG